MVEALLLIRKVFCFPARHRRCTQSQQDLLQNHQYRGTTSVKTAIALPFASATSNGLHSAVPVRGPVERGWAFLATVQPEQALSDSTGVLTA
jgi:hypothetical protein